MRWSSHAALDEDLLRAFEQVASAIERDLEGNDPHLVLAHAIPGLEDQLAEAVAARYPRAVVAGCSAGGIIAGHRELEGRAGLGLTAAHLPFTRLTVQAFGPELSSQLEARHLRAALASTDTADRGASDAEPQPSERAADPSPALIVALLDPKAGDPASILKELDAAFPSTVVIGGLASGEVRGPCLLVDGKVSGAGGLLIALYGGLTARAVVAQGCKPIGLPMLVTRVEGQLIYELGGERPLEVMRRLHGALDARDRALFQRSLFLGVEMRDQVEYRHGDFLIRNVLGVEPKSGALAVGAVVEQWKAVQFHLRDKDASAEDLRKLLEQAEHEVERPPTAALLFSCLGRGEGLYGEPSHDIRMIRSFFGDIPVGGFFCNGEVGPVSGKTYLHGYTSAIALISPLDEPNPATRQPGPPTTKTDEGRPGTEE